MELSTIEMAPDRAKAAADEYRTERKERRDTEDDQIERAYRELARGTPLLKLSEVMAAGGTTERKARGEPVRLPRLAIARADAKFAWTDGVTDTGGLRIQDREFVAYHNARNVKTFGAGTFERSSIRALRRNAWQRPGTTTASMNALIPKVPPPLRPVHHLRNYHLLWEAEWRVAPGPPPGDPALLKHIGGDLYAVLAVWDLTDVERAVLAGREIPTE